MKREQILGQIENFKKRKEKFLTEPLCEEILALYNIPTPAAHLAKTREDAVKFAKKIDFPVVLKVVSKQIIHKSDAGGVIVGVKNEEEVVKAFDKILQNAKTYDSKAEIEGIYVQKMASPGREVIVGAVKDAQFGHVVMFGLGGIFVEILKDVVFRVAPINKDEAHEMICEIKGFPVLNGVRGEKPIDFDCLSETVASISQLVVDFPQIAQLDINPIRVYPEKLYAVDARIILE